VSVSYDRVTLSLASYRCGGAEVPDPVQVALPVPLERESGVSQDHAAQRGYACGLAAATAGRSAGWPGRDACLRRAGAGAWLKRLAWVKPSTKLRDTARRRVGTIGRARYVTHEDMGSWGEHHTAPSVEVGGEAAPLGAPSSRAAHTCLLCLVRQPHWVLRPAAACRGLPRPATACHGLPRPATACHGLPRPAAACHGLGGLPRPATACRGLPLGSYWGRDGRSGMTGRRVQRWLDGSRVASPAPVLGSGA
jgi:hypothetical protein